MNAGTSPQLVLLAQEDALVGLDLRDALEEAGYRVDGPFGRTDDALFRLGLEAPDLAVLDLSLGDGRSDDLARQLRRQGVPFVVYSARLPSEAPTEPFAGAIWLDKPALSDSVVAAVTACLTPGLGAPAPAGGGR